ncbi:MAG TPA: TadE/TadG family type IV pilus assembly protein [Marmoricola sp.]|nr:TadE/TadG family type IV pilus assembly protein [Marmoricola sp.]
MADFVLVSLVLVPLVLGVMQVALVMYVRTTLTAAAAEGARYAATLDRGPAAGVARTRAQIRGALADRFASGAAAGVRTVAGVPVVEVRVHAEVPPLGLWGPAIALDVAGHAVEEPRP